MHTFTGCVIPAANTGYLVIKPWGLILSLTQGATRSGWKNFLGLHCSHRARLQALSVCLTVASADLAPRHAAQSTVPGQEPSQGPGYPSGSLTAHSSSWGLDSVFYNICFSVVCPPCGLEDDLHLVAHCPGRRPGPPHSQPGLNSLSSCMMAGTEGTLCSGRAPRGCEHPPAPGIPAVSLPLEPGVGHPGNVRAVRQQTALGGHTHRPACS